MKKIYGKPTGKELYMQEFYCAACNSIPVFDTWNRSTGKIVGAEIGELYLLPMMRMENGEREEAEMMICEGCMQKVKNKFKEELMKKIKRRPDDEIGGGGIPVMK